MSRARDMANGVTTFAPLASPIFTGTITAPNDSISGNFINGGTISSAAIDALNLQDHLIPAFNFVQETLSATETKNIPVSDNTKYLFLVYAWKASLDGSAQDLYAYFESFHVTVDGSSNVTISDVAPSADTALLIFTTSSGNVVMKVGHALYRANGMAWRIT
jgi:hypothetical protein